jgi:hypothetical protein
MLERRGVTWAALALREAALNQPPDTIRDL